MSLRCACLFVARAEIQKAKSKVGGCTGGDTGDSEAAEPGDADGGAAERQLARSLRDACLPLRPHLA